MDGQTRAGGPDGASPGAGRTDGERADAYRFALDTVLDGMRANVYVTDPATMFRSPTKATPREVLPW